MSYDTFRNHMEAVYKKGLDLIICVSVGVGGEDVHACMHTRLAQTGLQVHGQDDEYVHLNACVYACVNACNVNACVTACVLACVTACVTACDRMCDRMCDCLCDCLCDRMCDRM